jgi:ATP-dependent Zn protease
MGSDSQNWVSILINWFPMLLLIAAWIFFLRGFRGKGFTTQYQRDCMDLSRRNVEALERIAKLLETRFPN